MSKQMRERRKEEEKASKALGGATMLEVEGEEATEHDRNYTELQWFRLLHKNSDRLNQIANILIELAPNRVFDPRDIYASHQKMEGEINLAKQQESHNAEGKGGKKKDAHVSKKDQIIAKNSARLQNEAAKRDEEKLSNLKPKNRQDIKLETESGKLSYLLEILKTAIRDQNVVDALDTVWEVEEVVNELGGDANENVKAILKKHSDALQMARAYRSDKVALKKMNLVDFQLTEMSDRLPPLNLHALSGKFKLDEWQLRVIELIRKRKSVLITAPTSSGKTVLSTFVCATGNRVLFVVPTEPLAWQVAAMLRALKLGIALIVPTLNFVPQQYDVVVGTPHALESELTKRVGFHFDYAVFDEVHSLNNRDGEALQRLICAMPTACKFLALSATIGNAVQLKKWWESIVGEGEIELVQHEARFINLQRHIWTGTELKLLHPLAVMETSFLAKEGFGHTDMALTPTDSYKLWLAFDKYIGHEEAVNKEFPVNDLKPRKYFSDDPLIRITLAQAHEYEKALKKRLESLARSKAGLCETILSSIASGEELKRKRKKNKEGIMEEPPGNNNNEEEDKEEEVRNAKPSSDASGNNNNNNTISNNLEQSALVHSISSLTDLVFDLHKRKFTPCITFQLDSVRCQTLFDGMLKEIETREYKAFPDYLVTLQRQQRGLEKQEKEKSKRKTVAKEDGDQPDEATAQEFGEVSSSSVDVNAPHPDFNLAPVGKVIGLSEATDIRTKLREDLPSTGDVPHPLIRALRRGVGVYIEGLPSSYHRVVQALAQRGALGVVFSDELLAYGVNMPFRSAVFYGDPGREWLTPLLHQQMAGRAGRRGLDRQGHLIYAGFTPERVKELLRGELPDVVGRFPLYPTIPLQFEVSKLYVKQALIDEAKLRVICRTPLMEFLQGVKVEGYYEDSVNWVKRLGILTHARSSYSYLISQLVWELRQHLPESVCIEYCLDYLVRKFKHVEVVKGEKDIIPQHAMFLIFCRICSRQEVVTDSEWKSKWGLNAPPSWYGSLPSPSKKDDDWNEFGEVLVKSQNRIQEISDLKFGKKQLLLQPDDMNAELDNMCFSSFVRNQIDPSLPTPLQHHLRERLFHVGEVLRIVSNILGRSSELQPVQNLMRKCFIRVRYILDETFERNWVS